MSARGNKPDEIDRLVAVRLRQRRMELELDSRLLDVAIGETAGTIDKFERGTRRIGAAQLFRLGVVLGIDVSSFYREDGTEDSRPQGIMPPTKSTDPRLASEAQRFAEAYADLKDPDIRRTIRSLINSLAEGAARAEDGDPDTDPVTPTITPWPQGTTSDKD